MVEILISWNKDAANLYYSSTASFPQKRNTPTFFQTSWAKEIGEGVFFLANVGRIKMSPKLLTAL